MGNLETSRLNYNGHVISDKGDMLSLTDMWRAAGSDRNRQPSEWLDSADAKRFIDALELLKPENSRFDLVKTNRGGKTPGTWAHWQIGMAYAKYLDPNFHMWCNTQVRAVMEGKISGSISADTLEQIERSFGIVRMLSHKVTEIEKALPTIVTQALPSAVAGYIAEHNLAIADGVTAGEACDLAKVATHYPRGLSGRVSRRLAQFCARNGEKPRVSRLGRVRAQLFPTHLVREWLDIEGRALIKRWIEEKSGQINLRLVMN